MNKNEVNGVVFFTFDSFDKAGIRHCFTSRTGGVSSGCYKAMNLSFSLGDDEENVRKNFEIICSAAGIGENLVFSKQTHGVNVKRVTGVWDNSLITRDENGVDGLTTNKPSLVLTTFYADCVPLFFYDKAKNAAALSHAGWKGTFNKIADITVRKMQAEYGSNTQDIIVGIGPCICGSCFEISPQLAGSFIEAMPFSAKYIHENIGFYADLRQINREILLNSGIPEKNIEISLMCTMCNPDLFYSHRLTGTQRGSLAAFLSV